MVVPVTCSSTHSIVVVVVFAVALGIFCNIIGNVVMLSVDYGFSGSSGSSSGSSSVDSKRQWKAVAVQCAIATGLLILSLVLLLVYKKDVFTP